VKLATGAELRLSGEPRPLAVVCMNGGRERELEGSWSASLEWLVRELAPRFPGIVFAELRYRVRSWRRLEWCIEDAAAAIAAAGGERTLLVGFSMGGAVAVAAAAAPSVETIVALAPWIPERLPLQTLLGRRLAIVHGRYDRALPGIPGVSPRHSLLACERARGLGIECDYTLVPQGVHGLALRLPRAGLLRLPGASRWRELVAAELERFESAEKQRPPAPGCRAGGRLER
jgi:pimeloyl-ACP methyl ester carboxylesterase